MSDYLDAPVHDAVNDEARATWAVERPEGDTFTDIGTPYCSLCQNGTKGYICGPCERVIGREQLERERGVEWFS